MPVIASSLAPLVDADAASAAEEGAVVVAANNADSDAASADDGSLAAPDAPLARAASENKADVELHVVINIPCDERNVSYHLLSIAVSSCLMWPSATASSSFILSASLAAAAAAAAEASPARRSIVTLSSSALFFAISVASSFLRADEFIGPKKKQQNMT
jgi:hypothetical protein